MDTPRTISPHQLDGRRRSGQPVHLIDVRTPGEYSAVHADLATNVPLNRLDPQQLRGTCGEEDPLFIIGRQDTRGRQAYERLRAAGCDNVVQVEGGTEAWERAGLPVVRRRGVYWRRRWLAAGLAILAILLAGWWVHPLVSIVLALIAADAIISDLSEKR